MGMKQYQDKFKHEQVDGEILAECDEAVLTNDLGVTSKLHRMRLLKIISGMYMFSVLSCLNSAIFNCLFDHACSFAALSNHLARNKWSNLYNYTTF